MEWVLSLISISLSSGCETNNICINNIPQTNTFVGHDTIDINWNGGHYWNK